MKVLWFAPSGRPGGSELCLVEGVRALGDRGWTSSVVLPEAGPLAEMLEAAGARTRVSRFSWWVGKPGPLAGRAKRAAGHLLRWPRLSGVVREEAPDVVVSNSLAFPGGALAARAAGVPHAWFVHEFGREDHGLEWDLGERASLRAMAHLSDRVLVASRAVHEHFAGRLPPGLIRRVRYAVELPPALPEPAPPRPAGAPLELVLVGQKTPGKRQEDAVRALGMLARRGIAARLVMVGREDPAYGERLRALVREEGVEGSVRDLPFTPQPLRHVAEADAALVCSRLEAMGRVTVEAMKLGRPVVGAMSGGTADLVREGWNGLGYPPGDAAALAAALERLHGDRALLARMGENARAWANAEFTREGYGAGLAAALEEAVAEGRARSRGRREPTAAARR